MDKFLITRKSSNRILGPMFVTTSPRKTCPLICPLRKTANTDVAGACYAESFFLGGYIWTKLDQTPVGGTFQKGRIRVHTFADLLMEVRKLPVGTIWRHNQAGDLCTRDQITIDKRKLALLTEANTGRKGFTYTHFDVFQHAGNRKAIAEANRLGFLINLSANTLAHADALIKTKCGPVASILPSTQLENTKTPAGHKVVICPAITSDSVTCAKCKLCSVARDFVIGFPAHSRKSAKIDESMV